MSNKSLVLGMMAATVLATVAIAAPSFAGGNHYRYGGGYGRYENYYGRSDRRSDWGELRRDRAELRRDWAELERDRADLQRMYRNGASRAADLSCPDGDVTLRLYDDAYHALFFDVGRDEVRSDVVRWMRARSARPA